MSVTIVSYILKLQKVVSLSTTEEEYVAATEASKEMIWLQRFIEESGKKKRIVGCIVKTKVSFILQRTHSSIPILNIYNSSTIS